MQSYQIRIELKTETMFGNGDAIAGFLDADVQTDEFGLPFLKAKTLKGLLRENMELIAFNQKEYGEDVIKLFGDEQNEGRVRFSNAEMSPEVQGAIKQAIAEKKVTKDEIKRAVTIEYTYTKMENGIAKDHSLRTIRMLQKGLVFYAEVNTADEISKREETCIGAAVALLQHVGTLKSKGKGVVSCSLLKNGKSIEKECVKRLYEKEA